MDHPAVAMGMLNGRLYIVTANIDDPVSVLLGNSDGTFQAPVTYPVPLFGGPQPLAVGTFNGKDYIVVAADQSEFNPQVTDVALRDI